MKICLCGSTRYKEEYVSTNATLSKRGHIVYSVASFGNSGDVLTDNEKEILDLVHLKKILESDCILIVGQKENGDPYIGNSTRKEILWARINGKAVYYFGNKNHMLVFDDFSDG